MQPKNTALQRNKLLLLFLLFSYYWISAQEIPVANNEQDKSLSLVYAFISNTLKGNTITDFNNVNINTKKVGKYTLFLKILKYKQFREKAFQNNFDTILFNKKSRKFKDTPANQIIKKVIQNRKKYLKKTAFYSFSAYTKNKYYIKNAPKNLLAISFGDFNGSLDSTRSGLIYLSESFSNLIVRRKQLQETITAVKTTSLQNDFGFNKASETHLNLYRNVVTLGTKLISPIAAFAPRFYKYQLIDSLSVSDTTIYKIKVIPRHKIANVFNGYVYIVKDAWQLYKTDLYINGKQIQQPNIDFIKLEQQYKKDSVTNLWVLKEQQVQFSFNKLKIFLIGSYYTQFGKYHFSKNKIDASLLSYQPNYAKNDTFWKENRPIPLTKNEELEYQKKAKIRIKRTSKKYLDSITAIQNKFRFYNLLTDYNYRNLYRKYRVKISFPINFMFNTVQGWNTTATLQYIKDKNHQNYSIATKLNYGFSDKQLRVTGHFTYRFNDKVNSVLGLNFGRQLTEFNDPYSTAPLFNTLSTLLFEENNSKYYDKLFSEITYHQEIVNGVFINGRIAFENRKPAFNHSNFVLINWKDTQYTSNNPLALNDFEKPAINKHQMFKFQIQTVFKFKQKYYLFPNRKVNLPTAYPKLGIVFGKGVSTTDKKYNFDYIEARLFQKFKISNKGTFTYNVKVGKFLNTNELSFVDYKHFDITQIHITLVKDYTKHFALLPSYGFSTNDKFAEFHVEHNFNGYLFQKIPFFKKLQYKIIVGANTLLTPEHFPYSEFSLGLNNLGFGKYRFIRIDYVRTFIQNKSTGSFIFGLSL